MIASSDLERLALAQAVYKALGSIVSTKGDSLRARLDAEVVADYPLTGVKSRDVLLHGEKVGTYAVKLTKPVDGVEARLVDAEAFIRWIRESDGGMDMLKRLVYSEPARLVKLASCDGELPDGCRVERVVEPSRVSGAVLKVSPEKVAAALGDGLPSAVMGLLDGGGDE